MMPKANARFTVDADGFAKMNIWPQICGWLANKQAVIVNVSPQVDDFSALLRSE
jgi:hypothetical protein